MGRRRHLKRAPIQEALIDIQFQPVQDIDLTGIAAEFSEGREATAFDLWEGMFELKIEPASKPHASHSSSTVGKRIDFPERHEVLQLRNGGFTFSRLAPYESWEQMSHSALPAWSQCVDRIDPEQVNRIAVRYINALLLPLPLERFDKYLNAAPIVPSGLPQGIASFLTRLVLPRDDDLAIVTQSLGDEVEIEGKRGVKFVLDIDISHRCRLPREEFATIESVLQRLRDYKNDVFFSLLTDDTLEMYE